MAQSVSHVMLDHMSSTGVMHGDGRRRGEEMVKHKKEEKDISAIHTRYRNSRSFVGLRQRQGVLSLGVVRHLLESDLVAVAEVPARVL